MEGCRLQLRGSLRMKAFDRRVVPKSGLDALVVSEALEKQLQEIAHFDKARQILFGQWGFSEQMRERQVGARFGCHVAGAVSGAVRRMRRNFDMH